MNASQFLARITVASLALSMPLSVTSCVNPALLASQQRAHGAIGASGAGPQKNAKFQADQDRTVNQGTAAGAVVGTGLALAFARQLGPLGSLAVMAGGTMLGNQVGQAAAKKKADAMTIDANLDSSIKNALAANKTARSNVSRLQSQLSSLKRRANKVRGSGDADEIKEVKDDLRALQDNILAQQKQINESITTQQSMVKKVPGTSKQYAQLTSDISGLQQSKSELDSAGKEVASLLNSL